MMAQVLSISNRASQASRSLIAYKQMCRNEGVRVLERGLNFRLNPSYSVLLLSSRPRALYENRISPDGKTIECEGHDIRKNILQLNPKAYDQTRTLKCGRLTQNGLFAEAAEAYMAGKRDAELVRVYEKHASGLWHTKGYFRLTGYSYIKSGARRVFRFRLEKMRRRGIRPTRPSTLLGYCQRRGGKNIQESDAGMDSAGQVGRC
jgi:hypothetical protein